MQGHARIEGVTAFIHECYVDVYGNKVAEDAMFKTPFFVIIFDEAHRYRETQSHFGGKQMRKTVDHDRVGGTAQTWAGISVQVIRDALGMTLRSHNTFLERHSPAPLSNMQTAQNIDSFLVNIHTHAHTNTTAHTHTYTHTHIHTQFLFVSLSLMSSYQSLSMGLRDN